MTGFHDYSLRTWIVIQPSLIGNKKCWDRLIEAGPRFRLLVYIGLYMYLNIVCEAIFLFFQVTGSNTETLLCVQWKISGKCFSFNFTVLSYYSICGMRWVSLYICFWSARYVGTYSYVRFNATLWLVSLSFRMRSVW